MAHITLKKLHYTPQELGKLANVSRQTVVKWIKEGRIEAIQTDGGHWRIPAEVVNGAEPAEKIKINA